MRLKRISCFVCFPFIILGGCENEQMATEIEQSNDRLKICCLESDQSLYVAPSVAKFQQEYPDIKVELQTIPDDNASEMAEKLETELMGGNGADIYLGMENYFQDIYKIQKEGYFENLMPWFQEVEKFNVNDYVEGTFDLYEDGESCCVMPVFISSLAWASPSEIQNELGIDVEKWTDTSDILDAIDKFYAKWPEEVAFNRGAPFYLDPYMMGFRIYGENTEIFESSDIQKMEELYKRQVYPEGVSTFHMDYERYIQEQEAAIQGERPCLGIPFGIAYLDEYIRLGGEEKAGLFPAFTPDGKVATICTFQNAISTQSSNKENAFNFLQILLEENFENTAIETVRQDVNKELLETLKIQYTRDQVTVDGSVFPGLTDKTFSLLEKWEEMKEIYALGVTEINNRYESCMEPFYKGEKSYEDCIEEYIDYLEIYYAE